MHQDRSDRSRVGLGPGWPVVVAALALAVAQQACSNGGGGDPPKPDVDVGRSDAGFSDADQVDENRGKSDTAPDGDSMQRGSTIGPEGGQIPLPGGGLLSVPPGALAEPVEIVISEVAAPAPESFQAVGPFHSFAPSGLVFAVPATLTVPFDLEGLQAVPEDVSVVWSTDGGTYEPLPSDVDAADSSVSAEVSHFSDGGPAVFPEAMAVCCVDGVAGAFAGFLSLEDCTAKGGGPSPSGAIDCQSVCCSDADGPFPVTTARFLCAFHAGEEAALAECEQTCCVVSTGPGLLASVMSLSECAAKNGVAAGTPSTCAAACCGGLDLMGSPSAHLAPISLCAIAGLELLEEEACSQVCCLAAPGGPPLATVVSAYACTSVGGTANPDQSQCKDVCCAVGIIETTGVEMLAKAECEIVGKEASPGACDQVCCTVGEGDLDQASVVTSWACDQLDGISSSVAQCKPVCCSVPFMIPDPSAIMPKILCDQVGGVVDMGECVEVCCLHGAGPSSIEASVLSKAQCEAQGGESAGPPGKCSQACCKFPGSSDTLAVTVPQIICEMANGAMVDLQLCSVVCCFLPSGAAAVIGAGECDAIGGKAAGFSTECELVCCGAYVSVLDMSLVARVPKDQCPPENVMDPAFCQDVCCLFEAGGSTLTAEKTMSAACTEAGGKAAAALSACDEICCGLYNPMFDVAFGAKLPRASCEQAGGIEAKPGFCENVCCLVGGGSSEAAVLPESVCSLTGEVLGEPGLCEKVCCWVFVEFFQESIVAEVPKGVCNGYGVPLSPEDCTEVCCLATGGSNASGVVLPAKTCVDGGNVVVGPPGQCQDVCCSGAGLGFIEPVVAPAAACTPPLEAAPVSECAKVCCMVESQGDVTSYLATKLSCSQAEGKAFDETGECDLVCCGVYEPVMDVPAAMMLPKATCLKWGDVVDAALCAEKCCKTGDDVKLVPGALCEPSATVSKEQCETVCCKTGLPEPADVTGFKCALSGGKPVPQSDCHGAMTGCKGDGDCPSMDPCRTGKCNPGSGKCQYVNLPADTPCGAWDPCLDGAGCVGGFCVPHPADCDDGNPCTYDWCANGGECQHTGKQGAFCIGGPCVGDGICDAANECQSAMLPCSSPPPCHVGPGNCDPATGGCSYEPDNSLPCFDGDACTTTDHCDSGKCVGTASGICPIPCEEVYDCALKGKWHCDGGNVVSTQCKDGFCKSTVIEDCKAAGKACFGILDDLKPPACYPPDWIQCWTDADCPYGGDNYCVEDPSTNFIEKYECKHGNLPGCMPVQLKPCQLSFGTACKDGLCVMEKHDCCVADPYLMTKCSDEACTKLVGAMRRECTGFGMQPWGWSSECAELAGKYCGVCGGTPPPKGDCCKPEGTKGCSVAECEYEVCTKYLPACCQAWTQDCADMALTLWQCPVCN